MDREALLSKLSIRLSHLAEASNTELNPDLEALRQSLRNGIDEPKLNRISERLARHLLLVEQASGEIVQPPTELASEFVLNIRAMQLDKPYHSQLNTLADQLLAADRLDRQLNTLSEIFQLLRAATTSAHANKPSSGGLRGWLDKKKSAADQQSPVPLEKSTRLLDQAIQHIDVLNGNSNKTRVLKEKLEQPESADYLADAIDEIIALLKEHSAVIEDERATTQNFLGDLRSRLSGVEEAIFSVISDGDESLDRAVMLEQEVGDDVREMGKAVDNDNLELLKETVESGLSKLSSKVTDYLAVEKENHQESRTRVEDLNQKIRAMEEEALDLRGQIKDKQDLATKDALTGVYNRAGFEQRIAEELARFKRSKSPLSLVFVDCNKFKIINDTYGHAAGDVVLIEVAAALIARARTSDVIARYGGDEFVAVLPDTPLDGAEYFSLDTCQKILDAGFNANGEPLDVSISCGVTQARDDDTPETFTQRADEAMYEAKKVTKGHKVVVNHG